MHRTYSTSQNWSPPRLSKKLFWHLKIGFWILWSVIFWKSTNFTFSCELDNRHCVLRFNIQESIFREFVRWRLCEVSVSGFILAFAGECTIDVSLDEVKLNSKSLKSPTKHFPRNKIFNTYTTLWDEAITSVVQALANSSHPKKRTALTGNFIKGSLTFEIENVIIRTFA